MTRINIRVDSRSPFQHRIPSISRVFPSVTQLLLRVESYVRAAHGKIKAIYSKCGSPRGGPSVARRDPVVVSPLARVQLSHMDVPFCTQINALITS